MNNKKSYSRYIINAICLSSGEEFILSNVLVLYL